MLRPSEKWSAFRSKKSKSFQGFVCVPQGTRREDHDLGHFHRVRWSSIFFLFAWSVMRLQHILHQSGNGGHVCLWFKWLRVRGVESVLGRGLPLFFCTHGLTRTKGKRGYVFQQRWTLVQSWTRSPLTLNLLQTCYVIAWEVGLALEARLCIVLHYWFRWEEESWPSRGKTTSFSLVFLDRCLALPTLSFLPSHFFVNCSVSVWLSRVYPLCLHLPSMPCMRRFWTV